jgi:hypothetical protein
MMRRFFPLLVVILGLVLPLALIPACSDDDSSTKPSDNGSHRLAGGGRDQGDDPFAGGPEDSGPTRPDFEYPNPGFIPLFYSEIDCQQSPAQKVISNQGEWEAWWAAATACLGTGSEPPGDGDDPVRPLLRRGSALRGGVKDDLAIIDQLGSTARRAARTAGDPSGVAWADSGVVGPDSLYPYPGEAPVVDFEKNVVLTISLAPEAGIGRGVWVTEVTSTEAGTTVKIQVSRLGDDCFDNPDSLGTNLSSPTIAVLVPRPVSEPVVWETEEVVFDCSWEPDPNAPLALYYTDASCDLGPGEVVIRDADEFKAWVTEALACDQARWYGSDSTTTRPPDGRPKFPHRFGDGDPDSVPGGPPPPPPPPEWVGIDVDFTTHAVLILRAGPQTHWGGGIWLDGIDVKAEGTVISYTVMEPAGACPVVESGQSIQPTVAIRVPLPVTEPVTWNRRVEPIECGWRDGGPGTGTGPRPL